MNSGCLESARMETLTNHLERREHMAYTPELSMKYSGALRRIAWAYGIPMTRAIEALFDYASKFIEGKKVCKACRDSSFCGQCLFRQNEQEQLST